MIYVALQWAIVSIVAKAYSVGELGQYFYALAISGPVFLLFSLRIPTLVISGGWRLTPAPVIGARLVFSGAAVAIVLLIAGLVMPPSFSWWILASVLLFKFLEQIDDLEAAYRLRDLEYSKVFAIKTGRGALYCASIALFALTEWPMEAALTGATLTYGALWLFRRLRVSTEIRMSRRIVRRLATDGFPLGLASAGSSLGTSGARIYVGNVIGASATAALGAVGYAATAYSLVVNAIGQVFAPQFVRAIGGARQFRRLLVASQASVFALGSVGVVIAYFQGNELLRLAYSDEMSVYGFELFLLMVGLCFKGSSALLGTAVSATRQYVFQLKGASISIAVLIALLPIMTSRFGVTGAFVATAVSYLAEWVTTVFYASRYLRRHIGVGKGI